VRYCQAQAPAVSTAAAACLDYFCLQCCKCTCMMGFSFACKWALSGQQLCRHLTVLQGTPPMLTTDL
jgi:hypothetical protein